MLKIALRNRLLNEMIGSVRKAGAQYVVLVLDDLTTRILSSCCRMYDVMEAGVLVLQNIKLPREQIDLPAIYFLEPTAENIRAVVKDFPEPKKKSQKTQYTAAHLFFTSRVGEEITQLRDSYLVSGKFLKTFQELNISFVALDQRTFGLGRPMHLPTLYFPANPQHREMELARTSKQLCSLLLTLNEFPYIRYWTKSRDGLSEALARAVHDDMKRFAAQLPHWAPSDKRERGTLLIVDRSIDVVAPLLHEYTYQCMVNDLLPVKGEIVYLKESKELKTSGIDAIGEETGDTLVLGEEDNLWVAYRHKHIATVMADITAQFRQFRAENKMAQLQADKETATVKDMVGAMKEMPKYKDMMKKYAKHMTLAQACMQIFDQKQLLTLGELEQDMATGLDSDGNSVSMKQLKAKLIEFCRNPSIGALEKVRLVMIYIVSQSGIQENTRKELLKHINTKLQVAIRHLQKLGVDVATELKNNKGRHSKERLAEFAERNKTIPLALMRYVPYLHQIIQQLVDRRLSEDVFPYIQAPPPLDDLAGPVVPRGTVVEGRSVRKRTAAGGWRGGREEKKNEDERKPLFIVFVIGGVTFSEIRSLYEIAEEMKANLLIGSTSTITPNEFVRQLANISEAEFEAAVRAAPTASGFSYDDSDDDDDDTPGARRGDVMLDVRGRGASTSAAAGKRR